MRSANQPEIKIDNSNPHTINWHPMLRNWSYLIDTTAVPKWINYPNPCSISINAGAKITDMKYITVKFDISWQSPEEKSTQTTFDYQHQCLHPFQDRFYFNCEAITPGIKLVAFSPTTPNKPVTFKSSSSTHINPEIELALGGEHVTAGFKIGLGHYSHTSATSETSKAIEVVKSSYVQNKFSINSDLTYCKEHKTSSKNYDVLDPGDSLQRTKGFIFGWDYLLSPPDIAKCLYRMNIVAIFQLPNDLNDGDIRLNVSVGQRTTSYEIWKRVRGHRFSCFGLFTRGLKLVKENNNYDCKFDDAANANNKIQAVHTIHQSRARTNLFCCFYNATNEKLNKEIKELKPDELSKFL